MINLTINGKNIEAEEGSTILQVARQNNIGIPTLCHHESLEPYGSCRLCTVEVSVKNRKRFVTACNYIVKEGMNVSTDSPDVMKVRKMIVELLLARCPDVGLIKTLAKAYGIDKPRFKTENQKCILCGLCVRVCKEIIGASAISLICRGIDAKIDTPFHLSSEVCVGCGACAAVCPVNAIKLEYRKDEVEITPFNTIVKLKKCSSCGKAIASEALMDSVSKKLGDLKNLPLLCTDCKKGQKSALLADCARLTTKGRKSTN